MTSSSFSKAELAQSALNYVPPLIRQTLLDDSAFKEEFGFKTEAVITLGAEGGGFRRNFLFDAVRTVLDGAEIAEIIDEDGRTWQLSNEAEELALPVLVLNADDESIILPDLTVLSGDSSMRIRSLEELSVDVNLPDDVKERWSETLSKRALEDDEVDAFHGDIRNTPVSMERTILSELEAGQSSISSLVPNSLDYYRRLVGAYDGCASIKDYAIGPAREFLESLREWRPYEGVLFSLLLSSHSALVEEVCIDRLDTKDIVKVFEYLEMRGDMLSRLGAFEVGLRILPKRPEVGPYLLRFVNLIREDELEHDQSEFKVFSSLFVLVDGELSRIRLMSDSPPFYRRLASLAQAALIHRVFIQSGVEYKRFYEWAFAARGAHYYMQSLSDMRTEPRWNPDFGDAFQIQQDFFGRLMIAGNNFSESLGDGELREVILGDGERSLTQSSSLFRPYYSGPLEGSEDRPNLLPEGLARIIDEKLNTDEIDVSSFFVLVNSAVIFRVNTDHAELAVKAIRLVNYTLAELKDEAQLVDVLNGLATVAAVSRSLALADELRILVRRYLYDPQYGFSVEEAMKICLVASAAREDLMEWREFVGQWFTELAFGELDRNDAEILRSYLLTLLNSVPELWVTCAKADAALEAFCTC